VRTTLDNRFEALRLNSTFTYSDFETMTTYRAGDTINGGLAGRVLSVSGVSRCNGILLCAPTS